MSISVPASSKNIIPFYPEKKDPKPEYTVRCPNCGTVLTKTPRLHISQDGIAYRRYRCKSTACQKEFTKLMRDNWVSRV